MAEQKIYRTDKGAIHYWINKVDDAEYTLVFLPGLTADHRLFEKQLEYFEGKKNILVWDPPGHGKSVPFDLSFSLMDKAKWLEKILTEEGIKRPVIIGQSMGGYVGQAYSELYSERLKGFISIDSAPLSREYTTWIERFLLRHMGPIYYLYPWKRLLKDGTRGVSESQYGRNLMLKIMMDFDGDKRRYVSLASHGYRMLAECMDSGRKYEIKCPALLICGEEDHAGSCIRYTKEWNKRTGIPVEWIEGAGHNSNTDAPDEVNRLIEKFIKMNSNANKSVNQYPSKVSNEILQMCLIDDMLC